MGFSIDIKRGSVGPVQPLTPPPGTAVVGGVVANQNAGVDLAAHIADADPHPQYTTDAEATAIAAAAVAAHEAAADPHPSYATDAALTAAVSAHEAAANPHPQYAQLADIIAQLGNVHTQYLSCGAVQIIPSDTIDGGAYNETFTLDTYDGGSL